MKLISFCVPCYNSQDYMSHAIESLLIGGDDVEIILVDDGSKDNTGKIADEYQEKYPNIIKVVHKENGGHGSGVNKGIELASGLYFKVIDSDDWAEEKGYRDLLKQIRKHVEENKLPDLYIMDFLYNKPSTQETYHREFSFQFKKNDFTTWDEVKNFTGSKMFMMHALFYKTSVLRESKMVLPEHTFYVDNIFAFTPLPYVKTIFYIPEIFYIYYIGREGQSVMTANIIKRYQQQIRVMNFMFDSYSYDEIKKMEKGLRKYMLHALDCMSIVTLMFSCGENTKERKEAVKSMWQGFKERDKKLYGFLRHGGYSVIYNHMPFSLRGKMLRHGYNMEVKLHKIG